MFNRRTKMDALVVGAGPVGLCAAATLAAGGVKPTILDARWPARRREGSVILHPQSLGLLKDLSIAHRVLGSGTRVEHIEFFDEKGASHTRLDLGKLDEPYPYALVVPQQTLLDAFVELLAEKDARVTWHHRLTAIEDDTAGVIARVDEMDRESAGYGVAHMEEVVEASHVYEPGAIIVASGGSTVAERYLGGRMERVGSEGVVAVFETEDREHDGQARVIMGPHGMTTQLPLPHGKVQWSCFIDGGTYREEDLTEGGLIDLLGSRARFLNARVGEIDWAAVVPYEGKIATKRGRGHVWLAGDAAHSALPILSHPLNAGLAEAHTLGARLAAAIRGMAPVEDVGRAVEDFALETWAFLKPLERYATADDTDAWVREHSGQLAQCLPARRAERDVMAAQMGLRVAS